MKSFGDTCRSVMGGTYWKVPATRRRLRAHLEFMDNVVGIAFVDVSLFFCCMQVKQTY